jgi:arylsulfatase A-like enzyme
MALKEYRPGTAFNGVTGRTLDVSQPAWPRPLRAKGGAPNVLFIILDDTGFGQLGCYGSPMETPNLDRPAQNGLRYSNMHTTALCSPTHSCILTARNHHSNAMSCITEGSTGYPGGNGYIPFENGFLSEMLLQHGYHTYALGKWHLTPAGPISAAGPYDRWPLGRDCERFYGFLGGETHPYYPELVYDNHTVEAEKTPEEGYHLTEDLVDKAISFIADSKRVAPNKPFFMYFCTGAMHAPQHVPKEWADKYKGKFDDGWDAYREKVFQKQKEPGIVPQEAERSRHDPDVKRWKDCSPQEKKLYARRMEVFAGFLPHTDYHIGRLLEFLENLGALDNTLLVVLSDNGASSEGGPTGMVNEALFFNNVKGWRAVCPWPGPSFTEAGKFFGEPMDARTLTEWDVKHWELYHVAEDFAENHDLADKERAQLIEMIAQWYFEVTGQPDCANGKGTPGRGQLYIDGKLVGQSDIPLTNPPAVGLLRAINCGADPGSPVTPKYKPPFPFTGKIYGAAVDKTRNSGAGLKPLPAPKGETPQPGRKT